MGPNVFLRVMHFPGANHWHLVAWYGAGLVLCAPVAFLAARDEKPGNQIGLGLGAAAIWALYGLFAMLVMSV